MLYIEHPLNKGSEFIVVHTTNRKQFINCIVALILYAGWSMLIIGEIVNATSIGEVIWYFILIYFSSMFFGMGVGMDLIDHLKYKTWNDIEERTRLNGFVMGSSTSRIVD